MSFQSEYTKEKSIGVGERKSELKKQIAIFLPISEWRAIRTESIKTGIPITVMCRKWMQKNIDKLVKKYGE